MNRYIRRLTAILCCTSILAIAYSCHHDEETDIRPNYGRINGAIMLDSHREGKIFSFKHDAQGRIVELGMGIEKAEFCLGLRYEADKVIFYANNIECLLDGNGMAKSLRSPDNFTGQMTERTSLTHDDAGRLLSRTNYGNRDTTVIEYTWSEKDITAIRRTVIENDEEQHLPTVEIIYGDALNLQRENILNWALNSLAEEWQPDLFLDYLRCCGMQTEHLPQRIILRYDEYYAEMTDIEYRFDERGVAKEMLTATHYSDGGSAYVTKCFFK